MTPIYYRCRKMHHLKDAWHAWCGLKQLSADSPLFEPQLDIWFNIGTSEDDAIAKLRFSIAAEFAHYEWIRQETP